MIEELMNEKVLGVKVYDWQKVQLNEVLEKLGYTVPDETDLKKLFRKLKPEDITPLITDTVCDVMGISFDSVKIQYKRKGNRAGDVVKVRQFIVYYLHKFHKTLTLGDCGLVVGSKRRHAKEHLKDLGDHSVVLYYLGRVEGGININDQSVTSWIDAIDRELIKRLNA
tara:strand:- start:653 stop:1156 length:504 start_codon:yes stop_codon:yes gene_type:complete